VSLALYFDHNMPSPLVSALRRRGIDLLTSFEDGTERWSDRELWRKAAANDRILVTQDQDFLEIAHESQSAGYRSMDSFSAGLPACRSAP
jgi:predicted nuclease of predicted toxin-antitoxin system